MQFFFLSPLATHVAYKDGVINLPISVMSVATGVLSITAMRDYINRIGHSVSSDKWRLETGDVRSKLNSIWYVFESNDRRPNSKGY
jgi:hypothetical protein